MYVVWLILFSCFFFVCLPACFLKRERKSMELDDWEAGGPGKS